jgi:hypothetical protein
MPVAKILIFIVSTAITMALVQLVMGAFPHGESETRALLVCALVIANPFQTYWALKKLTGGL